jgi:predicted PurR-regulated permease PerM
MERNYCQRFVRAATKRLSLFAATICGVAIIVATAHAQQAAELGQTLSQAAQQGQAAGLQQNSQLQGQAAQQQGLDATQQTQQTLNDQQDQLNQQQNQDASDPLNQPQQPGQNGAQQDRSMIDSQTGQSGQPGAAKPPNWACSSSKAPGRECGSAALSPAAPRTKRGWQPETC